MKHRLWMVLLCPVLMIIIGAGGGRSHADGDDAACKNLPSTSQLRAFLQQAASVSAFGHAGGIFDGTRMWGAVVDKDGDLCAYVTSTPNPRDVWPGSQAIAKTKAYTANAYNVNAGPGVPVLSTANLYTFTQPGHSLWSLGHSNGFNPKYLAEPDGAGGGEHQLVGGQIFFGGGVPLYNAKHEIVGGLGVSGDTSCADHEIAKRVRHLAGLDPPGGATQDDISYSATNGASPFTHPMCLNTYRNGVLLGTENPAVGY
jgi:uncharacterized protein GlcG (DUF336 family)